MDFSRISWDFALILGFLAVVIPWRGKVRIDRLMRRPDPDSSERIWLYASTIAAQWIIAALVLWRALAEGVNFVELGMTLADPWKIAWVSAALTVGLCSGQLAGLRKLVQIPAEDRGHLFRITKKIMPRTPVERIVFVALASTAGISEEFLYRGFLFAVFEKIFSNASAPLVCAGLLSSVWFAGAHLYQGRKGIFTTFVVGIIFSSVRAWSGSLVPSIAAHACVDLLVGIALPIMLGQSRIKKA
jgi:membrane protease YdiL (CAAX protease family)